MKSIMQEDEATRLYEEGRSHRDAGRLSKAIEGLKQSAALLPHFKTLEMLGECYMKAGQYREAVIPLAAATGLNRQVRAPSFLAKVFLELGDGVKAREIARDIVRREPGNRIAKEMLSLTQDLSEMWDYPIQEK
jgi:tetratricopeptide (TPR) repeat protein